MNSTAVEYRAPTGLFERLRDFFLSPAGAATALLSVDDVAAAARDAVKRPERFVTITVRPICTMDENRSAVGANGTVGNFAYAVCVHCRIVHPLVHVMDPLQVAPLYGSVGFLAPPHEYQYLEPVLHRTGSNSQALDQPERQQAEIACADRAQKITRELERLLQGVKNVRVCG